MERKLPEPDPRRHIGRWAVSLNHRVFSIDAIHKDNAGGTLYVGRALNGDITRTGIPSLLNIEDGKILDTLVWENSE